MKRLPPENYSKTLTQQPIQISVLLSPEFIQKDSNGVVEYLNHKELVKAIAKELLARGAVFYRGLRRPDMDMYQFDLYVAALTKKPGFSDEVEGL